MQISSSEGWWFPRVSPNGTLVAAGNGRIKLWAQSHELDLGPGYAPQWFADDRLLVAQQNESHQIIDLSGVVKMDLGVWGANQQVAAAGRYALGGMARTQNRSIVTNFTPEIMQAYLPGLAEGQFAYVTCLEKSPGDWWPYQLILNGQVVWTFQKGTGMPSLLRRGAVAWLDGDFNWGRLWPNEKPQLLSVSGLRESAAVLVEMGTQVWVLSHQDDRAMFHPWASKHGQHWPLAEHGETHTPHGVGIDEHHARLAWNDGDGRLHTLIVDDSTPVNLADDDVPPEPPDMQLVKPGTSFQDYGKVLTPQINWSTTVYDRNNPELDLKVKIEIRQGRLYATIHHKGGDDPSGDPNRRIAISGGVTSGQADV